MELFKLIGTIAINNSVANAAIDNTAKKSEAAQSRMAAAFKKIRNTVAAGFAIDKIKDFGLACIETAATVNATSSQFEQTFGDMQEAASEAIKNVASESGILETRLQGIGTSIYAFAKTTGMESAEALGMMEEALQVAADSAAYYDRSLEDTTESLKSFLKGNFENDSALGLSCTETTRNIAANKLYGKSFIQLSESQKQLTLLQMVKDANELSGAMGQAARESDGWENVTGNLRESLAQLMAVIGQPLLEKAVPIVQDLTKKFEQLGETVKMVQEWLGENKSAIENVAAALGLAAVAMAAFKAGSTIQSIVVGFQNAQVAVALYTATTNGATVAQGLMNGTLTISEGLVALLTGKMTLAELATSLMAKSQLALNAAMTANPIGLVITAIALLVAAFVVLWKKSDEFREFWINIWESVKTFTTKAVDQLKTEFERLKELAVKSFEKIKDAIVKPFTEAWEKVNKVVKKIKNAISVIKGDNNDDQPEGNPKLPQGNPANVRANANGGILTKPTIFGYTPSTNTYQLGGEAGDEAIAPIETLKKYIAEAVVAAGETQPKQVVNNYGFTFNSPKELSVSEANRQAKRAYRDMQLGF